MNDKIEKKGGAFMLKDIKRVNLGGKPDKQGKYYLWNQICNCCGDIIDDGSVLSSTPPSSKEKAPSFCARCSRLFYNTGVSYSMAARLYPNK